MFLILTPLSRSCERAPPCISAPVVFEPDISSCVLAFAWGGVGTRLLWNRGRCPFPRATLLRTHPAPTSPLPAPPRRGESNRGKREDFHPVVPSIRSPLQFLEARCWGSTPSPSTGIPRRRGMVRGPCCQVLYASVQTRLDSAVFSCSAKFRLAPMAARS